MPQLPLDEPSPVPCSNMFDAFTLDGMEWTVLESSGRMAVDLRGDTQEYHGDTEDRVTSPQHDSIGGIQTYPRSEAGLIPNNISDSWEIAIEIPINVQDDAIDHFQAVLFSEASRKDITDRRIGPASALSTSSREDVASFERIHPDSITIGIGLEQNDYSIMPNSYSAIPQQSTGYSHGILSSPSDDQRVDPSIFTGFGYQNSQPFDDSGAGWTHAYGLSEVQGPELDSSWYPIDFPQDQYMEASSSDFVHIPEPRYRNPTAHWLNLTGAYANETLTGQNQRTQRLHTQQFTSPPLFTNSQLSEINFAACEDLPMSTRIGVDFARTNSPEGMGMMYHGGFPSAQRNVPSINSHVPAHDIIQNRLHQRDVDMISTGLELSTSRSSSGPQSNGRPSVTKREVPERGPTRTQTQQQKEAAYKVRIEGGACEHSRLIKKVGSVSMPCDWCQKIIGNRLYLALAICYKRNFWQVFGMYSDFFGIVERDNSIKSTIESMHGQKHDLFLGCGLRENLNLISIDIDPSSFLLVKTQRTTSILWQHTISTHDSNLTTGVVALMGAFQQESYAIVPESLPDLDDLDAWGRQDIRELARKWPSNLEAAYDLAFLEYLEFCKVTPQLPCYNILQTAMRIVSLGKNLDSRRPIDHNKSVEMFTNLTSAPQFGIEEFNECKARFQLSSPAKAQLYLHAARGIEETQRTLGEELDHLFEQNTKEITKDVIFLVGACLRRLGLEYRQRLLRYREFCAGTVDDRIERCFYMYTFFTRLYELWYRGRAKGVFPMSPSWTTEGFSQSLNDNKGLIDAFSKLNVLERKFCDERLNDSDEVDSFYKMLVEERAIKKSCNGPKVSKHKAHTWPSRSRKQPSASSKSRRKTLQ